MGDFRNVNLTEFLDDKFEELYVGEESHQEDEEEPTEQDK